MKTSYTSNSWVIRFKANPQAKLRLFCFPYAGGGPFIFRNWANSLPAIVEVCAIQLPGHGSRLSEKPSTDLSSLVEGLTKGLFSYLDKPFAFFGHSLGAILAFEVIRKLHKEHGLEAVRFFVSARRAPHILNRHPATYNLPDDLFMQRLRRLNGTPSEVLEHPELMQLMLPVLRADFQLSETYTYSEAPPLSCPINAFGGLEDENVSSQALEAWQQHTAAPFTLKMLPGNHFFLHTHESDLLNILSDQLRSIETLSRGEGRS